MRVCLDKGELGSQNGVCIVSLVTDRSVLRKRSYVDNPVLGNELDVELCQFYK